MQRTRPNRASTCATRSSAGSRAATLVGLSVEQDGPALTLRVREREREATASVDVSVRSMLISRG